MSAREAWAIKGASGDIIAVHIGDREQSHISDELLERRGMHVVPVRILAHGALDRETLEAAAKHLEGLPSFGDGRWAARVIRALGGGEG